MIYIVIPVLIAIILVIVKIAKLNVISLAKDLILYAEKNMKTVEGQVKLKYVCNVIQDSLPRFIKPFITEEHIIKFVQKTFDSIYEYLDHKEG